MSTYQNKIDLPRFYNEKRKEYLQTVQLVPKHTKPLYDFYQALSQQSTYFFEPYKDRSLPAMEQIVKSAVEGIDASFVVLNSKNEVIAHIFYQHIAKEIPHLGIGIRDDYQNCGLGHTLMSFLVEVGHQGLGKKTIGLTVMKDNHRAVHLYQKMGFVICGEVTFRSENDSHIMERVGN